MTRFFKVLFVIALFVLVLVILYAVELPKKIGVTDFRGYWSTSYLLSQSENFSDSDLLLQVQRELVGLDKPYPIKTWNPPWVLVWLLPYAVLPFKFATKLWLFTNIMLLVLGVAACWQVVVEQQDHLKRWIWLPLIAAIVFPSTLVAIRFGQVNLVVFAGLVGFLWFYQREQDVLAGTALALTMVKPHLVYLALPIIFLYLLKERRFLIMGVFAGVLVGSIILVFMLRPGFLNEYLASTQEGNLFKWQTPTTTTYLSIVMGVPWIRLIGVILIPIGMIAWYFWFERLGIVVFTEIAVLFSVITMPFGWSYDYVVLLLPLSQIIAWLLMDIVPKLERAAIVGLLLMMYGIYYRQRIYADNELYFFWVPLVIAVIFAWLFFRRQSRQPFLFSES